MFNGCSRAVIRTLAFDGGHTEHGFQLSRFDSFYTRCVGG